MDLLGPLVAHELGFEDALATGHSGQELVQSLSGRGVKFAIEDG